MSDEQRELAWIGQCEKDFSRFPQKVQVILSQRLTRAARGARDVRGAKALTKGILKGRGVVELILDFDGDTYRAVYTTRIGTVLAVLHAFKKKSKTGIGTPAHVVRLIRDRYRTAMRLHSKQSNGHRR